MGEFQTELNVCLILEDNISKALGDGGAWLLDDVGISNLAVLGEVLKKHVVVDLWGEVADINLSLAFVVESSQNLILWKDFLYFNETTEYIMLLMVKDPVVRLLVFQMNITIA